MSWLCRMLGCETPSEPLMALAKAHSTETVSPTSPARLLAASLNDPETRDEWVCEQNSVYLSHGYSTSYRNERRSLNLSRYYSFSLYSSSRESLNTPFTLSDAEQKIVLEAMRQFDRRVVEERETQALARLVASADTHPQGGDVEQAPLVSGAVPKADAQNTPSTGAA